MPCRIISVACPIACVAAAQAVVIVVLGPFALKFNVTWAAAMLGSTLSMKKGSIRMPPFSIILRTASSVFGRPPNPLPIETPSRSGSMLLSPRPESSNACRVAATAYWLKRAMRRASLRSM